MKTLVLERREMVGGCSVTEELWPGYRVSTAAYLSSLLQEKIVRELDLVRHGYHVTPKDPPSMLPPSVNLPRAAGRRSPGFHRIDPLEMPAVEDGLRIMDWMEKLEQSAAEYLVKS